MTLVNSDSPLNEVSSLVAPKPVWKGLADPEFVELVRAGGKTGVVITHNIAEALSIGSRVLVMRPPGLLADDVSIPANADTARKAQLRSRILNAMDPEGVAGVRGDQPATQEPTTV